MIYCAERNMKMISVPFFIRRSVYHPRQRISYPQGISSVTDAPRGSRNEFDEFRGMGRERISWNPRLTFASRGFRIAADDRARRAPRRATGSLAPGHSDSPARSDGREFFVCASANKTGRALGSGNDCKKVPPRLLRARGRLLQLVPMTGLEPVRELSPIGF